MTLEPDLSEVTFTDLARHGERPAILTADGVISYRDLGGRVEDLMARLGPERRLVMLVARNDLESLIGYLAAMTAGHPLLLAPADKPAALESLLAAYEPDVVLRAGDGGLDLEERWPGTRHELHRDLALLLSTSGSTGSPKLVRLSRTNLAENARAIAEYLGIGPDDRAATTLPFTYCYGLSVINSHLIRGASLVLTDLSVVDPCFWDVFRDRGATSFAAVPYSFDLLDRVGFAEMDLPSLRYITQAGGR
ncbi:AMP-binding protein, partial [Arthrobacter sp. H41]|uniref:AMP-binding protein n=1 Tax=Arthrobacter sp. H41 TaxID=1312978 RepID=UPI00047C351E